MNSFSKLFNHVHSAKTSQDDIKVLEKDKDFKPPVDIAIVKSRIGAIELDKHFSADEDWFKGLTVRMHNKAEKPITYVSLLLYFPRPKEQKEQGAALDFGFFLEYGVNPVWVKTKGLSVQAAKPIPPGQYVELALDDTKFNFIRAALVRNNYPQSVKALKIKVEKLGFADETIWFADEMFRLDEAEPGRLIPLQEKKPA